MAAQERAHLLGEGGFLGGEPEMHGDERKHLGSALVKRPHFALSFRSSYGADHG
jgi:hypothetical protein